MKSVHVVFAVTAMIGAAAAGCYAYADHQALRRRIRFLLSRALPVLKASGARHFLAFGTLLGHIRDHDVISGDTDGDIGVFASDAEKVLAVRGEFRKAGIDLEICGKYLMRLRDASLPYVYTDLYMLDGDGSPGTLLGSELWGHMDKSVVIPADLVMPIREASFLGVDTMVPGNSEGLLEHTYGRTWRTPKRHDKGVHARLTLTRLLGFSNVFCLGLSQLVCGK
jgi:hypothetical protein